jgi:CRP-like cAMP-binding protein
MINCQQCVVKEFKTLRAIGEKDLILISGCKTPKLIKKGEILFREGESINGVYCVKEGVCKLSKLSANGKDQIVKLVVKGNLIGQRSLVNEEKSNLTAIAVNDMKVSFIPKHQVLHDLNKNVSFSMDMLQEMAKELKHADDFIVDMAQKSVKHRLADVLIFLNENLETDANGYLGVILSREDYAGIVGTASESAIRILSQFKKEGIISTEGKKIKIENLKGLQRID